MDCRRRCSIKGARVLLVDNNEDLLRSNQLLLEQYGYRAYIAASIREAMQILDKNKMEIVVMETIFNDGDGFDFCRRVSEKYLTKIMFLTGLHGREYELKGLNSGCHFYITKPYDVRIFLEKLSVALRCFVWY